MAGDTTVDEQKHEDQPVPYEEGKENSHQDNDPSEQPPLHFTPHKEESTALYKGSASQADQQRPTEDERSIANRLAAAKDQNDPEDGSGKKKTEEQIAGAHDPTLPAKMHGNEPSRGAKIDKSIEDEEAEILRRMDESKAAKKKH